MAAPIIKSISVSDLVGTKNLGKAGERVTITLTLSEALAPTSTAMQINGSTVIPTFKAGGPNELTDVAFIGYDARKKTLTYSANLPILTGVDSISISLSAISLNEISLTGVSSRLALSSTLPSRGAAYTLDTTAPVFAAPSIIGITENSRVSTAASVKLTTGSAVFSLMPSSDASLFSINNKTGKISLKTTANFEAHPSAYSLTVLATDSAGNSSAQNITIPLNDVQERMSLASNVRGVGTLTAVKGSSQQFNLAKDFVDPDGKAIAYSLATQVNGVTVNPTSGVVTLASMGTTPISFTLKAADSHSDISRVYRINPVTNFSVSAMSVSDAVAGGSSLVGKSGQTVNVSIQLSEPLSGSPVLSSSNFTPVLTVGKGTLSGITNLTLADDNRSISFSAVLPSGTGVESNSVILKGLTLGSTLTLKGFHSDAQFQYDTRKPISAAYRLDNTAPVMATSASKSINENIGSNQWVFTPSVKDSSPLSYSLQGTDASLFTIESTTGKVTLVANPNYEAKSVYNFTLQATDAASNSASQSVTLRVANVKEAPQFLNLPNGRVTTILSQGKEVGISVSDPDDIPTSAQNLSLIAQPYSGTLGWLTKPSNASIDAVSGKVTITGTSTQINSALATLKFTANNYSGNNSANVQYSLSDKDKLLTKSTVNYAVTLRPQIDSFALVDNTGNSGMGKQRDSLKLQITLSEDVAVSGNGITPVMNIGGVSLSGSYLSKTTITDGSSSKAVLHFNITLPNGDATGFQLTALSFASTTLTGSLTGQAMQSLTGLNLRSDYVLDSTSPSITSATAVSVAENISANSVIYSAQASDLNGISYTLINSAGSTDASLFVINNGSVSFANSFSPNFEDPNNADRQYQFTVVATDPAGNNAQRPVTVSITDINEPAVFVGLPATATDFGRGVAGALANFTVADPENATLLSLRLTPRSGDTLVGAGTASAGVYTITGTAAQLNSAIAGLQYRGAAAADNITLGLSLSDGTNTTTGRYLLNVKSVPVISFTDDNAKTISGQETDTSVTVEFGSFAEGGRLTLLKLANGSYSTIGSVTTITAAHVSNQHATININKALLGSPSDPTSYSLKVRYASSTAGATTLDSPVFSILVDQSPQVVGMSFSAVGAQNGFLNAGDTLTANVQFSEIVNVPSGVPILPVQVNGQSMWLSYKTGSGTNSLSFSTTIDAGRNDQNGISVESANSILLNGGKILDSGGNPLASNLPAIADNTNFRIDTSAPSGISIAYGTGVSATNGASKQEAISTGAVTVNAPSGETISVLFKDSRGNTVVKSHVGTGTATAITLDASDLGAGANQLTDGAVTVVAGDTAGNGPSVSFNLDAKAPSFQPVVVTPSDASFEPVTASVLTAGSSFSLFFRYSDDISTNVVNVPTYVSLSGALQIGSSSLDMRYISTYNRLILTYSVAAGVNGTITLDSSVIKTSINNYGIKDHAGNLLVLPDSFSIPAPTFTVDTSAPAGLALNYGSGVSATDPANTAEMTATAGVMTVQANAGETVLVRFTDSANRSITKTFSSFTSPSSAVPVTLSATDLGSGANQLTDGAMTVFAGDAVGNGVSKTFNYYSVGPSLYARNPIGLAGSSGNMNGYLNAGDILLVDVNFDRDMTINGASGSNIDSTIKVDFDGVTKTLSYSVSLSSSRQLVYAYTIAAGDTASSAISLLANSLSAGTGSIKDAAGYNAILLHDQYFRASGQTIAGLKIDTTAPSLTGVTLTATGAENGLLNVGDVVTVRVGLSETTLDMTGITGGKLVAKINVGGSTKNASLVSSSATSGYLDFAYTLAAGDTDANGISVPANTLVLQNGGVFRDLAGNTSTPTSSAIADNTSFLVDTSTPAGLALNYNTGVSASNGASSAEATAGPVTVTTGSSGETIIVKFTDSASPASTIIKTHVSTSTSATAISLTAADLTSLADGTITAFAGDPAGNGFSKSFVLDRVAPSVTSVSLASDITKSGTHYKAGDVIKIVATYSETIAVTGVPTLNFTLGSDTHTATYASVSGSSVTYQYTLAAGNYGSGISMEASTNPVLPTGAAITDTAGNSANPNYPAMALNTNFAVDAVAPYVDTVRLDTAKTRGWIAGAGTNGYVNDNDHVIVAVTMSEPVTVSTGASMSLKLIVGTSTLSAQFDRNLTATWPSNMLYFRYVLSQDSDSDGIAVAANLTLSSGSIKDAAGNNAKLTFAAVASDSRFIVDNTAVSGISMSYASGVDGGTAGASDSEAKAGMITVSGTSGVTSKVQFMNGAGVQLVKDVPLVTGTAVAVPLTAQDINTLGNGWIYVAACNATGAIAKQTSIFLDTVAPNIAANAVTIVRQKQDGTEKTGNLSANDKIVMTVELGEIFTGLVGLPAASATSSSIMTVGGTGKVATWSTSGNKLILTYTVGATDAGAVAIDGAALRTVLTAISDKAGNSATVATLSLPSVNFSVENTAPTLSGSTSLSVTENSSTVGSVTSDESVTWTLSASGTAGSVSADNDLFSISSSGVLTFKAPPNFEAGHGSPHSNDYKLQVTATDLAGNTSQRALTVSVTNVNEAPVANTGAVVLDFFTAGTRSYTLASYFSDVDANTTLSYSLLNAAGNSVSWPAGLSLSAGTLSGTASATMTPTSYILRATDEGGLSTDKPITFAAWGIPLISSTDQYINASDSGVTITLNYPFTSGTVNIKNSDGTTKASTTLTQSTDSLSFTIPKADLSDGSEVDGGDYKLKAEFIASAAGSATLSSVSLPVFVDSIAPDRGTVSLGTGVNNGASRAEALQATGVVNVRGENGADIKVTFRDSSGNTLIKNVFGLGTGTDVPVVLSSTDLGAGKLTDGSITVSSVVTDSAGNTSASSTNVSFNLDATAPSYSAPRVILVDSGFTAINRNYGKSGEAVAIKIPYPNAFNSDFRNIPDGNRLSGVLSIGDQAVDVSFLGLSDYLSANFNIKSGFNGPVKINSTALKNYLENYGITDVVGNPLKLDDSFVVTGDLVVDTIVPTVTKLTLLAPDLSGGYLASGKELSVRVEFSENVRVTGTPQIKVEIVGSSLVTLNYLEGSGSSYLLFKTTIVSGASDHDGVMIPADSIALNGGSINDLAGNAAVLSHAYLPADPTIRIGANPFPVV